MRMQRSKLDWKWVHLSLGWAPMILGAININCDHYCMSEEMEAPSQRYVHIGPANLLCSPNEAYIKCLNSVSREACSAATRVALNYESSSGQCDEEDLLSITTETLFTFDASESSHEIRITPRTDAYPPSAIRLRDITRYAEKRPGVGEDLTVFCVHLSSMHPGDTTLTVFHDDRSLGTLSYSVPTIPRLPRNFSETNAFIIWDVPEEFQDE